MLPWAKRMTVVSPPWKPPAHQKGVPSASRPLGSGTMRTIPGRPMKGSTPYQPARRWWCSSMVVATPSRVSKPQSVSTRYHSWVEYPVPG